MPCKLTLNLVDSGKSGEIKRFKRATEKLNQIQLCPPDQHRAVEPGGEDVMSCTWSFGRSKSSDICIPDVNVSRHHAQICLELNDVSPVWFIRDCASLNGVYVNNVKISKRTRLSNRDTISLGVTAEDANVEECASNCWRWTVSLIHDRPDRRAESDTEEVSISPPTSYQPSLVDAQRLCEKLRAELTCPICNELFISPVNIPCGHAFCHFCIRQWRANCGPGQFKCPTCRAHIGRLPTQPSYSKADGLSSGPLTPNRYLANLVQTLLSCSGEKQQIHNSQQPHTLQRRRKIVCDRRRKSCAYNGTEQLRVENTSVSGTSVEMVGKQSSVHGYIVGQGWLQSA